MNKRVIVTGGAGFIGSHLCKRLLDEGCRVVCVDNFYTGRAVNIQGYEKDGRFSLIRADVRDEASLPDADEIYHLACPASPVHYQRDRVYTMLVNVVGTDVILRHAEKTGGRVLLTSTSEVYGDPAKKIQSESYWGNVNPNGVRSCYDEGKRAAESLMVSYHDQRGVDIRIARIFNTYGPNMDPKDGRVVSNFIVQALSRKPLTIYGDGSQTRSFCYVSDMVDGLIALMGSAAYTDPTNLGNPDERSIGEIAQIVKDLTKTSSPIVFEGLPKDDPRVRRPDIGKARRELGWEPKVTLEEGMVRTIDYFRTIIA